MGGFVLTSEDSQLREEPDFGAEYTELGPQQYLYNYGI